MLLVSRSELMWYNIVWSFPSLCFPIAFSWCKISSPFMENNNVVISPYLFHIFMPLANLWFIYLKDRMLPWPLPVRPPSEKPLALARGRIFISGCIRSPPTLTVKDIVNSLSLGGVGKEETWRHFSYLSGTLRELYIIIYRNIMGTDWKI